MSTLSRSGQDRELCPGDMVDHFRVMRRIGRGGMGEVYLARDTKLGRKVALKVLQAKALGSPQAVRQFLREARHTARFNHPHILTIYAVGEGQGDPYVALEYLEGQTLRQRLSSGPVSASEALRIGLAIAQALAEAHRNGILHRDLKPENVMIPPDGRLRVLDFGLAKSFDDGLSAATPIPELQGEGGVRRVDTDAMIDQDATLPGMVSGTPSYMAPEQWTGEPTSGATDIWALGVILYELVAGKRPYGRELGHDALAQHVLSPAPVPAPDVPGLPPEVWRVIGRCLAKDPSARITAEKLAGECEHLLGTLRPRASAEVSPFRGLEAFDRAHAPFFFGREAESAAFFERLRQQPVLPVVGPAGAGKSSFVQAGIVPRLAERGQLIVIQLRPGDRPHRALAERLCRLATRPLANKTPVERSEPPVSSQELAEVDRLAAQLMATPRLLAMRLRTLAEEENAAVLLFVDQLEELYTMVDDRQLQQDFVQTVCSAADDAEEPIRVIFTLRDDFLGRVRGGAEVREALGRVTLIQPPGAEQLREIALRPVETAGYAYDDPGLVDEMVAAVQGEQASLPLLQFACRQLWDRRDRDRRRLLRDVYEQIGGVAGALARHADSVLEALSPGQVDIARQLLLRLVTADGTRKVCARAQLEALGAGAAEVLDRLVQARLLAQRKGMGKERGALVELTHDSLIVTWRRLARWIEGGREELAFLGELDDAATLWQRRGRRSEEVWRGVALRDAQRAIVRHRLQLADPAASFIATGLQQERRRLLRRRGAVLAAFALLAVVAAVFFIKERETRRRKVQAERQRVIAEKARARAQLEGARAALARGDVMAAQAQLRSSLETDVTVAGRALWWEVQRDPRRWRRDMGSIVHDVVFSPDGRYVAAAGHDRTAYVFDVRTAQARALRGHRQVVLAVAFGPRGRRLVSASWGQLRLWDLETGTARELEGPPGAIWGVDFSPDGKLVAAAGWNQTVWVIDVAGKKASRRVLLGHRDRVFAVRFSPDGKTLASASFDRTLRLWNPRDGSERRVLRGHRGGVRSVDFSPDGKRLASGSIDKTIRIWDAASGRQLRLLAGHQSLVWDVAFSPDGRRLVSGSRDKTVMVWDLQGRRRPRRLEGHRGAVQAVAFSPDGALLASAGSDQTLRLWRSRALPPRRPHTAAIWGVAFDPRTRLLAAAGHDHRIHLWDVASGREQRVLVGHHAMVSGVAFSPDGKLLASASRDRTVRLWDVSSGAERAMLVGHRSMVYAVAFSADGKRLASVGADRTVRLWDVSAAAQRALLAGHQDTVWDVAFGPGGRLLASASRDKNVRVWDARDGSLLRVLSGHRAGVYGVAFTRGGQLLSGSGDGTLWRWNPRLGTGAVQARQRSRVYYVASHPDGERAATSGSDGVATVWDGEGRAAARLRGHRSEVNYVRFSSDGKLVATSSDDGTARLWRVADGRPFWHTPGLLPGGPWLYSHRGWKTLGARPVPKRRWRRAVEGARLLASDGDASICLLRFGGTIERWDLQADRVRFRQRLRGVSRLLAFPGGCAAIAGRRAHLVTARGVKPLRSDAGALAWDGKLLVGAGAEVLVFSAAGQPLGALEASLGVTALARIDGRLVLGFANGAIEIERPGEARRALRGVPASPVERIVAGPRGTGTVVAGFANGMLGLWSARRGERLMTFYLHGPVRHLLVVGDQLFAASELGEHRALDLALFKVDACDLLRVLWQNVPVVWRGGAPALEAPPADHRCAAAAHRR